MLIGFVFFRFRWLGIMARVQEFKLERWYFHWFLLFSINRIHWFLLFF